MVREGGPADELVGRGLRDSRFPSGALIALVHRDGNSFVPTSSDVIKDRDRLTIIGNPEAVEALRRRFESREGE